MTETLERPSASAGPPPAPRKTDRKTARAQGWVRRAPLLPALIFTIIITQVPFLLTIFYSLQSWNLVRPGSQEFVWFDNYLDVFADSQFRGVALNTVIMTVGSVLIAVVLGLGLALLLNRAFVGRSVVRTLLVTPFLITPVAAALLWKTTLLDPTYGLVNFLLSPFGAGDTAWISDFPLASVMVALIWQWTPFMMLLLLAGLQSMPLDQLEAARMDGAGAWAIFRELTLPHLRRFIELGTVLGAIYLVNTFDAIFTVTQGGPGTATTNLPYEIYQTIFSKYEYGEASAAGVVVVILTIIVANFALRVISGLFKVEEGR